MGCAEFALPRLALAHEEPLISDRCVTVEETYLHFVAGNALCWTQSHRVYLLPNRDAGPGVMMTRNEVSTTT
jgi:hypothetical protein